VSRSLGGEIRLLTRLEANPPTVRGDPSQVEQSLMNLVINARDAIAGRKEGEIVVATRTIVMDRDSCARHPGMKPGPCVLVSVTDNGCGMPRDVQARIFEPFFTTKGPAGTGLGLAMVYGIVSRHGGEIAVDTAEGRGSTFTIRLPVPRGQPAAAAPPTLAPRPEGARVLVIDDEPVVRETLGEMLRQQGHHVVAVDDGASGLARFRAEPFDLVMTDLAMPGMSGWQVAQAVKAARPHVPVVVVTGWGVELSQAELRAHGVDRVLGKPFEYDDVRDVVASFRGVGGTAGADRA
jgi:CheY-like chemotaxis protein